MTRRTILPVGPVLVALMLLLNACADESDVLVGPPPGRGPGGPVDEDDPPAAGDPDVLVSVNQSPGGMAEAPPQQHVPDFELRADGTVFAENAGSAQTGGSSGSSSPFGIDRYRLTEAGIDHVRDLFAGVSFDDDAYGEATITDAGTTDVYVAFGQPVSLSVYALDHDQGFGPTEAATRSWLVGVLEALADLPTADDLVAEPLAPYRPAVLDIAFQPAVPDSGETLPEPVDWPLDEPLTERTLGVSPGSGLCTTVDGEEAATVAALVEATADGDVDRPWSTGAAAGSGHPTTVAVTVRGLLPGDEGCRADQPDPAGSTLIDVDPLGGVELADPATWDGRLPADQFEPASMLDVYAAVPILAREAEARAPMDEGQDVVMPNGSDLSWYAYRAVAAAVGGQRFVDLEASYEGVNPDPWEPPTWRVRIDLRSETVTELDLD